MTKNLYAYVTRGCFIIGTLAVLCLDHFSTSRLPIIFMVGAALISATSYIYSRVKPLEVEEECPTQALTASAKVDSEAAQPNKYVVTVPPFAELPELAKMTEPELARTREALSAQLRAVNKIRAERVTRERRARFFEDQYRRESSSSSEGSSKPAVTPLTTADAGISVGRSAGMAIRSSGKYYAYYSEHLTYSRNPLHHELPPWRNAVEIKKMLTPDYQVKLTPEGVIEISGGPQAAFANEGSPVEKPAVTARKLEEWADFGLVQ